MSRTVLSTHIDVVMPQTITVSMPRAFSATSSPVPIHAENRGLSITRSVGAGVTRSDRFSSPLPRSSAPMRARLGRMRVVSSPPSVYPGANTIRVQITMAPPARAIPASSSQAATASRRGAMSRP